MTTTKTYLPNLISIAEVVNILSASIVLLAGDQRMHGTRFSTEGRNCRDISSTVFNLKSAIKKNPSLADEDVYWLYFKSESVAVFPCTGRMIFLDAITASNDRATGFTAESTTLYDNQSGSN